MIQLNMKHIFYSLCLLSLFCAFALAEKEKEVKGEPLNIDEVCNNSTSKEACKSTLKYLGADTNKLKPRKFIQKVIRLAQSEFGQTSTKAREKMREDDLDMKIKKSLSHCVKLYLDMANELRSLFLGAKSSKYETDGSTFSRMAKTYPKNCEDGLTKVGTSGEKLKLYDNYKDLEDLASTIYAVGGYYYAKYEGGDIKKS